MTPNENALAGMRCPECGAEEEFRISASSMFQVDDSGTIDHEEVDWDDGSYMECKACHYGGIVMNFKIKNQPIPPGTPVTPNVGDDYVEDFGSLEVAQDFVEYLDSTNVDKNVVSHLRSDMPFFAEVFWHANYNPLQITTRISQVNFTVTAGLFKAFEVLKHFRYLALRAKRADTMHMRSTRSFDVSLTAHTRYLLTASTTVNAKDQAGAVRLVRDQIEQGKIDWTRGAQGDIRDLVINAKQQD